MSREEMQLRGWEQCDVIIVTGDAYVDHPSFGMAVIGRTLEACGYRVGIISQPDWRKVDDFRQLGEPRLFFGVTAGNMDSLINHYTADKKPRSDDAYSPDGETGLRPDRATLVYSQRCREAFRNVPVVIGGIEASLRRIAHYDYWSDKVRRSFLVDAKADMLVFGNGERQVMAIAGHLASGKPLSSLTDLRGTAFIAGESFLQQSRFQVLDLTDQEVTNAGLMDPELEPVLLLPSFEQVSESKASYAHASRSFHGEMSPDNGRRVAQFHGDRLVICNQPALPLETPELDSVFNLQFTRMPHPRYQGSRFPAYEMIRFSVNIMRGCFGGCSFCSITEHEGKAIQSRSEASILREVEIIRDKVPGFTGVISDLGGPTANMWRMSCTDRQVEKQCRRPSCVFPTICSLLDTDHQPLVQLYRKAREMPGIKKVAIASGLRYDLAVRSPEYVEELVKYHVGGYLKIAPEHSEEEPLELMMKPGMDTYYQFEQMFNRYSKEAGKEQYLIPYFIAGHPGSRPEDMLQVALWLKQHNFRLDQVQNFIPSPMARASSIYHTGVNVLRSGKLARRDVFSARGDRQRRVQKAFLRYHDPDNWPLLRKQLKQMGRADLVGNGAAFLVPASQPAAVDARVKDADRIYRTRVNQLLTGESEQEQQTGRAASINQGNSSGKSARKRKPRGWAKAKQKRNSRTGKTPTRKPARSIKGKSRGKGKRL
jgi:uncharacterized radical SAM protein YgiQ